MHLIYLDESGNTGLNLNDSVQPIFVLAALVVPEERWMGLEQELLSLIETYFPAPRPVGFEIHAKDIRNGSGYFRAIPVGHRVAFRDACLDIAGKYELKVIYRAINKKRFARWTHEKFGAGIAFNPHVFAFPLVARVIDDYLASHPESPRGIFISDENREIIADVEKAISLLRVYTGSLRLGRIVEKGFFIDSSKSVILQLCDLCACHARKREEQRAGIPIKPMDEAGIRALEPLIHNGNEAFHDTLQWWLDQQQKKKERPGETPGSV